MSIDRREFMKTTAALAAVGVLTPRTASADQSTAVGWKALQEGPMAYNPATWYRPCTSKLTHQPGTPMWFEIDLGEPDVTLTITSSRPSPAKIGIRIPSWAASSVELRVNRQPAATGTPGTYATLDRTWSTSDTIHFTLPIEFKLTRYEGLDQIEGHHRFALEYGPVLMALIGSDSAVLAASGTRPEAVLSRLQQDPFRPLHFNIEGFPQFKYVPYWQVLSEPFTCFPVIDLA